MLLLIGLFNAILYSFIYFMFYILILILCLICAVCLVLDVGQSLEVELIIRSQLISKTDSPFPRSHLLFIAPQLVLGSHEPLSVPC